jgi:hypothetical protein
MPSSYLPNTWVAPDLEEMDEQQACSILEGLMTDLGAKSGYEVRHEDFAMERPQSGERTRVRERMRGFQAAFGEAAPAMRLRRVVVREGPWVAEVVSDYGGQTVHYVSTVELKDAKMWRDTRYYAEPFEDPGWGARWVEQMEP